MSVKSAFLRATDNCRGRVRHALEALRILAPTELEFTRVARPPAPAQISEECVYIVDRDGHWKWATFRCPGGCGRVIKLRLNTRRRPSWSARNDLLNRTTFTPSVRQRNACRCHFWVRRGKVEWCLGGKPNTSADHSTGWLSQSHNR